MVRGIGAAVVASLFLGAVMALGDYAWATLHIQHRVGYGLAHGAIMCLCLGVAIGIHVGRPLPAAAAGPFIGVIAAGVFYLLAPQMRMIAMFPAWMAFWILFALLQMSLRRGDGAAGAAARGVIAAVLSGLAFYAISGIWTGPSAHEPPNAAVHFAAWTFAFLPGFLALFWRR
jgi:hypothetical protein